VPTVVHTVVWEEHVSHVFIFGVQYWNVVSFCLSKTCKPTIMKSFIGYPDGLFLTVFLEPLKLLLDHLICIFQYNTCPEF
jgi:hypothetical protein